MDDDLEAWLSAPDVQALAASDPSELRDGFEFRPLIARAAIEAPAVTVEQLTAGGASTEMPAGPSGPGPVQGIGPGGPIQISKADANGNVGTYICTASYLFRDEATGTYYLGTAGHCLLDGDVESSTDDPDARARWVRLCYADCINNYVGLGRYVQLDPGSAYPGYHPVAWAEQRGPGNDFGLIEIPPSVTGLLRPWMWLWGGPTGFQRPSSGTVLTHYGFGIGLGQTTATQGRLAATVASSVEDGHAALGWVNGGDSGSAFGTAGVRDDAVIGDAASGTITHAVTTVGAPLMWGTDLEGGLDKAQAALGFRPELVPEDATIGAPSSSPSPRPSTSPSPTQTPSPSPSESSSPSPSPSQSAEPSPAPSTSPTSPAQSMTRELSLRTARTSVPSGGRVRLHGVMSGDASCDAAQVVKLVARRAGASEFRTLTRTVTDADGSFSVRLRPRATKIYRAVAPATSECDRARSRSLKINVRGR